MASSYHLLCLTKASKSAPFIGIVRPVLALVLDFPMTVTDDDGNKQELEADERYYAPSEISWYLTSLRFKKSSIHGCRLGNFSRNHVLTTDDFEMLVIAEK